MNGYDINKFPNTAGMIIFPISISRIRNAQDAQNCFEHIEKLVQKISKPWVGVNFIYGDNLYLYSDEPASKLKNKHQAEIISHKNAFMNILDKNPWYIQSAVNFTTWNQVLLESRDFLTHFGTLKKIYNEDESLKEAIQKDFVNSGRNKLDENQINFFLEESLIFYMVLKGILKLSNKFLHGHEEWLLHCYPGKPLETEKWLHTNNPLKLSNEKNRYQDAMYDLSKQKLVNLTE